MASPITPALPVPLGVSQRILVVEDLEDQRASLQELLQLSLGVEVDTAEDGAKGLEMLRARPYSLVITDLTMPHLDGYGLLMRIRESRIARIRSMPVVVVSGAQETDEQERVRAAGATALVGKGTAGADLLICLASILQSTG